MRGSGVRLGRTALIALSLLALGAPASCQPPANPKIVAEIKGPDGSWDYASFDAAKRRVLISRAYGVMAIDADSQAVTRLAPGDRVHANVLLPDGRILITNGISNTVTLADGTTGAIEASIPVDPFPDAAVYDPASGHVFVMNGASGFITVIHPAKAAKLARIPVGGKLEFAAVDGAGTLFVNVEDKAQIAVIDTKSNQIKTTFKLAGCEEPTGLAYVAPYHLLISACGNGHAKVLRADDGHEVADIGIGPHPDAVLYDQDRGVAFIPSAGSILKNGEITVLRVAGPASVSVADRIATERGARTIAEDPKTGRLYLPTANYTIGLNGPHPVDGTFRVLVVAP
jgi:DNA-binding beta-propeller fold protein YncE